MVDKFYKLAEDRYRRFLYTLNQCGMFLLHSSDEEIETCIFEDFDIGIRNDVSDDNLELFLLEGWIDEEIKERCLILKSLFLDIPANYPQLWNVQSVKVSEIWIRIMELADEILPHTIIKSIPKYLNVYRPKH